jgi:hypothetical protein
MSGPGSGSGAGYQFRGTMVTLKVLPWRLQQLPQRSFRSRSSNHVWGGRPCCHPALREHFSQYPEHGRQRPRQFPAGLPGRVPQRQHPGGRLPRFAPLPPVRRHRGPQIAASDVTVDGNNCRPMCCNADGDIYCALGSISSTVVLTSWETLREIRRGSGILDAVRDMAATQAYHLAGHSDFIITWGFLRVFCKPFSIPPPLHRRRRHGSTPLARLTQEGAADPGLVQ